MECIHDMNANFILKEKSYIMGQAIGRNGRKTKTKKAMAPLIIQVEQANLLRSAQELKAKWHSLRSSVLR